MTGCMNILPPYNDIRAEISESPHNTSCWLQQSSRKQLLYSFWDVCDYLTPHLQFAGSSVDTYGNYPLRETGDSFWSTNWMRVSGIYFNVPVRTYRTTIIFEPSIFLMFITLQSFHLQLEGTKMSTKVDVMSVVKSPSLVKWVEIPAKIARYFWQFTSSDVVTFGVPNTVFEICCVLAGPPLISGDHMSVREVLWRIPAVVLFNWSNLLIFVIASQRLWEPATEDQLNKPWRPMSQGLVTRTEARLALQLLIPAIFAINHCFLNVGAEMACIWRKRGFTMISKRHMMVGSSATSSLLSLFGCTAEVPWKSLSAEAVLLTQSSHLSDSYGF